jgi:hypothetical protein
MIALRRPVSVTKHLPCSNNGASTQLHVTPNMGCAYLAPAKLDSKQPANRAKNTYSQESWGTTPTFLFSCLGLGSHFSDVSVGQRRQANGPCITTGA